MKLLKKILLVGATLIALLGVGAGAVACGGDKGGNDSSASTSAPEADTDAYVYRVSVQNETGFGFSDATVKLMDGDRVVAIKKTNASGNANFLAEEVSVGKYKVVVEDTPDGYTLPEESFSTIELSGTDTVVALTPTGVLEGEAPVGHTYQLGDIMYDFTVTTCDNKTYTLSEVLKEKQLVLLNFWATWCTPCKSEFPAMHDASIAYKDSVSVLALSTDDGKAAVADFQKTNGYTQFNMGSTSGTGLDVTTFPYYDKGQLNTGIPHTVMIDRYGVVVFNEVGAMTSVSDFIRQFDKFIGEEYRPTVIGNTSSGENSGDSSTDASTQIKPNVTPPKASELKDVLTEDSAKGMTFRFQEEDGLKEGDEEFDAYNWPWLISEDKSYIYASNINVNNSHAILYSTIEAKAGDVLAFDYKVGSESYDYLYVMLDGEIINKYSGYHSKQWNTSYCYVFKDYEVGKHEVAFVFLKDGDKMSYDDVVHIKDLRILSVDDLNSPNVDANIFRQAATVKNADSKAKTQFKNYVDVVLNENDQYYHVGNENGPVLYANLLNASHWNETSIWLLAYNDYIVGDGMNFHYAVEDFAWEATQPTTVNGYTPVTEDLKYLLDAAARYTTFGKKWNGEYHENEWLEVCIYWEHYGQTELPEDPMAGITFTAAIPMQEGSNPVSVPYQINPRGFKYKFIPERSGAYHVYSTGYYNTEMFLVASDRTTMIGRWDDKVFDEKIENEDGELVSDENFDFYWYFNAGETYYMLFTTYMDDTVDYNVNIDYLGETYTYLTNAAVGPYSANLNTFEMFLPDAISYAYSDPTEGGDGYYHHVKEDGTLGSIIYLDVNRPTAHFPSQALYDICREAENYKPEYRALYINGVDYTPAFKEICYKADIQSGELRGFAAVDKTIFDLLQKLTVEKHAGIDDSWLLMCYYYVTLDPTTN